MSVLPAKEADELRTFFKAHLTAPVTLDYFTLPAPSLGVSGRRECETSEDIGKLLTEVAALSEKIVLRVHHVVAEPEVAEGAGTERGVAPAIVLTGAGKGRVRFLGFPDGLEFGTLLRSLVGVSTGTTGLTPRTKLSLGGLGKDVHIRVFVTPTCPFCPRAAQIAVDMAIEELACHCGRGGGAGIPGVGRTVPSPGCAQDRDQRRHRVCRRPARIAVAPGSAEGGGLRLGHGPRQEAPLAAVGLLPAASQHRSFPSGLVTWA